MNSNCSEVMLQMVAHVVEVFSQMTKALILI